LADARSRCEMTTVSEREEQLKMAAARSAVGLVTDDLVVGLGTGSTAALAIRCLGERVREGLRIVGVPTSERSAAQARALGIRTVDLGDVPGVDLTIDGADDVEEGSLNLIKGLGGALLREKIVACASKRLVIIVHGAKLVPRLLGPRAVVPIEVTQFGWQVTSRHLGAMGATPSLRRLPGGAPFETDSGNFILDCAFESSVDAPALAEHLDHVVGVVEHGLFIRLASEVHVASAAGVRVLTRSV
jgi:ribose 5-phosphate isomerase A